MAEKSIIREVRNILIIDIKEVQVFEGIGTKIIEDNKIVNILSVKVCN